ncbi:MAG TPA: tetratricopeptide repeat protein [Candidatus Angelobacter sp.]|jgi:tetratricopeptide (TPR) repeat protein
MTVPSASDPDLQQALALHGAGEFARAAASYAAVPEEHPHAASILYFHAGACLHLEGLAAARHLVTRAATLEGWSLDEDTEAGGYLVLADSLRTAWRMGEALPCYEIALQLSPGLVSAHVGLGLTYAACNRPFEAAMCFQSALRLDAHCVAALVNLGTMWRRVGQREAALPCYRLAVKLAPNLMEAHFFLGTLLCELRELDEAVAMHRRALALAPNHPSILTDLGSALALQGQTGEGHALLQQAVTLAPGWPVARVNLGIALSRARHFEDALLEFKTAQDVDPKFVYAQFCESNVYLMQGDYERGYALYDAHRAVFPHRYLERCWDGSPLNGRTILLYAQHGLGDTLQFVRYVSRVAGMGGRVILQIQPQLLPLFRSEPAAAAVLSINEDPGPFDVQATLLELPAILGDSVETIPADVPYLRADPELVNYWRTYLNHDRAFKIGIAWHGNPNQKDGLIRRCALRDMAPVWGLAGVSVYSLQVGAGREELSAGDPVPVVDLGDIDRDGAFMDTAAIMEALDLVITIDTSIAHLAGGLGRPVWMVVPYWADWRWMIDRTDSPWYPTMRIFRQPQPGEWEPVFAELASALSKRSASR